MDSDQTTEEKMTAAEALAQVAEESEQMAEASEESSSADAVDDGVSGAEFVQLQAELAASKAKEAESYEQYVRAVAEMENTRRRAAQDVLKAQLFGIESFAKNLLPVVDSLEKAVEAAKNADEATRQGIESTHKQLMHALEVSGMTPIAPAVGAVFNPADSQAIAMVPAPSPVSTSGTVASVFQTGWKLNDRVLRPAMVAVVQ